MQLFYNSILDRDTREITFDKVETSILLKYFEKKKEIKFLSQMEKESCLFVKLLLQIIKGV